MEVLLTHLQRFSQPWLVFLAEDPALRLLQIGMLLLGCIVIFLVFFATKDILLRTHSFWYMCICIILVALLPIVGFLLYILIRPPRTIKEREQEEVLVELLAATRSNSQRTPSETKGGVVKKKKAAKKPKGSESKEDLSL